MGWLNLNPPVPLLDWRLLAIFAGVGLLLFPFMTLALMWFHAAIGTGLEFERPRLDRCFFRLSRPLDTMLLAAGLVFWQGLGVLLTFWICWPHNFILGVAMILGYYSITFGIRMTLASRFCRTD